jgi:hypothetical protein
MAAQGHGVSARGAVVGVVVVVVGVGVDLDGDVEVDAALLVDPIAKSVASPRGALMSTLPSPSTCKSATTFTPSARPDWNAGRDAMNGRFLREVRPRPRGRFQLGQRWR